MKTFLFSCGHKQRRLPLLALAICAAFTAPGCIEPEEVATVATDTNTTTEVSNPPVGVVDDSAGFYVIAQANENYTYITHRGDESGSIPATYTGGFTRTRECSAELGDDIMCYVEANELDLWFNGLTLQHNVPSTMCSYVTVELPWYFKYPLAYGPKVVGHTFDARSGTAYTVDNANSSTGKPYCPFDYTAVGGPNCCLGSYHETSTTFTLTGEGDGTTETDNDWGGDVASCLGGPATDLMDKDALGFPLAKWFFVKGVGLNGVYDIKAPFSKGLLSNVYAANYFDIAADDDYSSVATIDMPPAFSQAANRYLANTSTNSFGTGADADAIVIPSSDSTAGGAVVPVNVTGMEHIALTSQPFYSYTCLNRNQEVLARIRVMVRSWDKTSQYDTETNYTPDYSAEGGVGGTLPNHDRMIWGDLFFNYSNGTVQSLPTGAVRKSRNSTIGADCTGAVFPCQAGYSSFDDGFPLSGE